MLLEDLEGMVEALPDGIKEKVTVHYEEAWQYLQIGYYEEFNESMNKAEILIKDYVPK